MARAEPPLDTPYALESGAEPPPAAGRIGLVDRVAEVSPLPFAEVVRYLLQVGRALREAEKQGRSHGFVRPDAVVLDRHPRHCCEAEKFRARLLFETSPFLSEATRSDDREGFRQLALWMLDGERAGRDGAEIWPEAREVIARLRQPVEIAAFCESLEEAVRQRAFPDKGLSRKLLAWALEMVAVAALFWGRPELASLAWLSYDGISRQALGCSPAERLLGVDSRPSWSGFFSRAGVFAVSQAVFFLP